MKTVREMLERNRTGRVSKGRGTVSRVRWMEELGCMLEWLRELPAEPCS